MNPWLLRLVPVLLLLGWDWLRAAEEETPRPNIVLIMADDLGFSDIGCYGGEIKTPNLNQMATNGVRFTQFYNTARCCPTRAALMTGLYPHQAGVGLMTQATPAPGYQGQLNRQCVTIAEVLQGAGYSTYMAGKWHLVRDGDKNGNGTKAAWPMQRGFQRYFGTIDGAGNYFAPPTLIRDNTLVPAATLPKDFYYTTALGQNAAQFIREHAADVTRKKSPFFLYLAYTAPHWPLHAPEAQIAKYRGTYLKGWDKLRQERHTRQLAMKLVDARWPLSPRHPDAPAWESLSEGQRKEMDERMAIYAAMVDMMDQSIGLVMGEVEKLGLKGNTLTVFLADNGGCDESGLFGFERNAGSKLGTAASFASYGLCWANASNTPFRFFKKDHHEGGIASPLIVQWPARLTAAGELRDQPGHVIDLMPTCVEVARAKYPKTFGGQNIVPMEGRSLMPALEDHPIDREAIYWEHVGNRGVRAGDWKLVSNVRFGKGVWELYNLAADRTEQLNLAGQRPDKVQELEALWTAWAKRAQVLPKPAGGAPKAGSKKAAAKAK